MILDCEESTTELSVVTIGYLAAATHPESTEADQETSTSASQEERVQRVNTMLSNLNEGVSRTGRTNIHFVKEIHIQVNLSLRNFYIRYLAQIRENLRNF